MARSKIWKYYDKLDLQTAQCLLCEKIIKTCGNTSNLMKHMKTHPQIDVNNHESIVVRGMLKREPNHLKTRGRKLIKYQSLKIKSEVKPDTDPDLDVNLIELVDSEAHTAVESVVENVETYANWATAETESGAETVSAADIIEFEPKVAPDHMQEETTHAEEQANNNCFALDTFAYFVCRDMHPLGITQGEGFRRLAQMLFPAYPLPSPDQLGTRIAQKALLQTSKLRQHFANLQSLSLSCSINTTSEVEEVNYLEVVAHYHEGVQRRSRTLLVQTLPAQYNANHVVERLERVCERFDINKSKIMCIVSRSNHMLESAIATLLDNQRHVPCFAHQIETIFESVMQHQEFSTLCDKVRRRNVTQQQLQLDVVGRPLSCYEMLERYVEQVAPLDASPLLSSRELMLARELLAVLAPLVSAVRQLCGTSSTSYPSASVALPIAYTVLQEMKQPENAGQQHQISYELRLYLIEQLEKCYEIVEKNVQLALSSLLDPRFRNMPFQSATLLAKYMTHLYELCEEKEASGTEESPSNATNGYDIWAAYRSLSNEKHKHIAMNGESENQDEISSYFCTNISSLQVEPMLLWKDLQQFHPFLHSLAKKFLHIPASAIPPVRLFTDAGAKVLAQHGKLVGENMNNMLFMADCTQEEWQL